jgi:hypothetical protein
VIIRRARACSCNASVSSLRSRMRRAAARLRRLLAERSARRLAPEGRHLQGKTTSSIGVRVRPLGANRPADPDRRSGRDRSECGSDRSRPRSADRCEGEAARSQPHPTLSLTEWMTAPRDASRCSIAIPSALHLSADVGLWLIDTLARIVPKSPALASDPSLSAGVTSPRTPDTSAPQPSISDHSDLDSGTHSPRVPPHRRACGIDARRPVSWLSVGRIA